MEDNEASQVHINYSFPDEQLIALSHVEFTPWFADLMNYLAAKVVPTYLSSQQRKRFFDEVKPYYWEDPILYKHCVDQIILRCILEDEMRQVIQHCHSMECGGNFGGQRTVAKVLQLGFYWPTLFKDAQSFVKDCNKCQRMGNISSKNGMPLEVELSYVWGIDSMGPFPSSCGNKYILLVVDFVS